MFDFSSCEAKSNYYDDSNKFAGGKMKDETGGVAIEELVGLKLKMCSVVIDDSNNHKKAKGKNKNVVVGINHGK